MKRHKELLDEDLSLAPIKLLGGFICIDFHLGCSGCLYCLNRRHPFLHALLERKIHLDMPFSPATLAAMVLALPSARDATVPIRLGHMTDWFFQKEATAAFCAVMPADYPMVTMTRYPLDAEQVVLLKHYPHLLVHMTVTPPIPGMADSDPEAIVASTATLPQEQVVYMLRPLVVNNDVWHQHLLQTLPPGSQVAFGAMSTDSIPNMAHLQPVSCAELDSLRRQARASGLLPLHMFGCSLRQRLQRPFFKYQEVCALPDSHCSICPNERHCRNTLAPWTAADRQMLVMALARLELSVNDLQYEPGSVRITTDQPAGRAEEVYLSEWLNRQVLLNTVSRGEAKGIRFLDDTLYQRWERTGFLPVTQLRTMAATIRQHVPGLST